MSTVQYFIPYFQYKAQFGHETEVLFRKGGQNKALWRGRDTLAYGARKAT